MKTMSDAQIIDAGTSLDAGSCCGCDTSKDGVMTHIAQRLLYLCAKPGCADYCCPKHRELCGYCTGCCSEEHGLGSH